jgi:hypothetical protein
MYGQTTTHMEFWRCPSSPSLWVEDTKGTSTPITIFLLFFIEVIQLLVAETNNKYYNQYLDIPNNDSRHNSLM